MTMAETADGPGGAALEETREMRPQNEVSGRAGYARAQARSRMDAVGGRAREKASELTGGLKEKAAERAEEVAARATTRVSGIARAVRRAGEELRAEGDERLASLTEDMAAQIERVGSWLDGKSSERMLGDLEAMAKRSPAFFVGGTFAAGLLLGRFLRADEPREDVDIVFEPEGDWTGEMGGSDDVIDEGPYDIGGDNLHAMTPDIESISDEHPSTPSTLTNEQETPVRTPIAGRETMGPGIRTGSSGAAALDAGSAGSSRSDGRRGRGGPEGGSER
jgi:hypothetical protein